PSCVFHQRQRLGLFSFRSLVRPPSTVSARPCPPDYPPGSSFPAKMKCEGCLVVRGASVIRIGARIYACRKGRELIPPLGAGFEVQTCTTTGMRFPVRAAFFSR